MRLELNWVQVLDVLWAIRKHSTRKRKWVNLSMCFIVELCDLECHSGLALLNFKILIITLNFLDLIFPVG